MGRGVVRSARMRRTDPDVDELTLPPLPPLPDSPERMIRAMAPLVTERRLRRMREAAAGRTRRFVPILESLADPHNGAAIMRTADAHGLQEVHVIPGPYGFHASRTVAKGTQRWLELRRHASAADCVSELKQRGFRVLFATMDGEATPTELPALLDEGPLAIAFGNEHRGPSPELRELADGGYRIPMRGFVESLNVSVAAAITIHAAVGARSGDLGDAEREELLARWLMASIKDSERILAERLSRPEFSEAP